MTKKFIFIIGVISAFSVFYSCKKDESNVTPPRDVTEVRNENNAAIETFLNTHSLTFTNTATISETVVFSTTSNTSQSIAKDVRLKTLELDVIDANNQRVRHKMYYMILQEGTGTTTTVADSVYVNYKGQLLNLNIFDQTEGQSTSNWIDLIGNVVTRRPGGTIKGFSEGIAKLKDSSSKMTQNSDGTLNMPTDGGVGVFIIPSGLGYFSSGQAKIPAYSPLIFTIRLGKTKRADHDHDGKASINEIQRDEFGIITYPNCNANNERTQTPDYLDPKCK